MARSWFSRNGLNIYVSTVVLAGAAATVWSLHGLAVHPVGFQWYVLVALTLVSGTAVLKIPGVPANFTISDTFTITAAALYVAGTLRGMKSSIEDLNVNVARVIEKTTWQEKELSDHNERIKVLEQKKGE